MSASAFLDRGVVLGYCFTVKKQHRACRDYLSQDELDFYVTEEVESIFEYKKDQLTQDYSDAILDHVADLTRSKYDGELGPMEQKGIQERTVPQNEASRFLSEWYQSEVPQLISMYGLKNRLRNLARDINSMAEERKDDFDALVTLWERETAYPGVRDNLAEIEDEKEEDLWICIDAHDLAVHKDGHTELATTDLSDFIRGDKKQLILGATALNDVIPVAEDSDQRI